MNTCVMCGFFLPSGDSIGGSCTRFPPSAAQGMGGRDAWGYPAVLNQTPACGEYKAVHSSLESNVTEIETHERKHGRHRLSGLREE